jgi:ubiquinone/menaquinone biosynthesis C-methylase UbiE
MAEFSYSESDDRLAVRIRAHTEYANFQLEDWLARRIDVRTGGRLLDVACGNGNFFPIYASRLGSRGLIVGFDVSDSLLAAAQRRAGQLEVAALVFKWDFDSRFPLLDHDFDCTVCLFAAYYVKDAQAWVDEAIRVTRPGGQILVLGPTEDNATELYDLNQAVTGIGSVAETDFTTSRLTQDFLPALRKRLGNGAAVEVLDRKIVFPTAREFARYYLATWLYEKTVERTGRELSLEEVERNVVTCTLSKRVIVLEARP